MFQESHEILFSPLLKLLCLDLFCSVSPSVSIFNIVIARKSEAFIKAITGCPKKKHSTKENISGLWECIRVLLNIRRHLWFEIQGLCKTALQCLDLFPCLLKKVSAQKNNAVGVILLSR
jgi:hypothetical protein